MQNLIQINVRVPAEQLERLRELAEQEGLKTADLLRRAVREYLERSA